MYPNRRSPKADTCRCVECETLGANWMVSDFSQVCQLKFMGGLLLFRHIWVHQKLVTVAKNGTQSQNNTGFQQ
ncbi:hypothetical protein Pfo_000055 [Paulownia fortunei]|nr:hypothetical protein Pfo_000055 [Paulownia fortunei]